MSRLPPTRYVFLVFYLRLCIALLTSGFFQPDEFFQALEPAHQAVFGYGHLTWEWAANPPIRSFVYPALFVPAYTLVNRLGLDETFLLVWAPKLVQVMFATCGDVGLYILASSILSPEHGAVSLFLSLISPFNALALTRTLSNSTEASLTTMALVFWPFPGARSRSRTRVALGFAALSCIIRPTGVVLWMFLGLELIWRQRSSMVRIVSLAVDVASIGIAALALTVAIDSAYYGMLTFTPISFIRTNILSGTARFYGVNAFHYYLTQGLPIVLGPTLPFALNGIWSLLQRQPTQTQNPALSILFGLVAWTLSLYSCLAHKEWRFIHPLLPVLHIFAADSLVRWGIDPTGNTEHAPSQRKNWLRIRPSHLAFLLATSLPLNSYLLLVHGSAQITASRYLHTLGKDTSRVKSIGVLMPCHSIPWQSHIHIPHLDGSRLWALGCEPPLGLDSAQFQEYESQTDVFFETAGPIAYFDAYFPPAVDPAFPPSPLAYTTPGSPPPKTGWNHTWPSHILTFGALEKSSESGSIAVGTRLRELGYAVLKRIKNGWEEDERRKGGVVIWEWAGTV